MATSLFSFSREEHLKSKKRIENLFSEGRSVKSFPLRAQFKQVKDEHERTRLEIGFVVSKRSFNKAVDRNRIKRQMIEVFRLNRASLMETLEKENCYLDVMLIYIHREKVTYEYLEKTWKKLQSKVIDEIQNKQ